jgi:hypothetical protein|tara:strand:- start:148 stop:648 length:501 start_codon:yes stop_codon:yes gene_type:complete
MDYIDDMSLALPNQQQVGESNADFKRFQYYLGLGASRTLKKVSNNFSLTDRRIYQISSKHQWVDRVKAINRMLNEQIVQEVYAQVGETARDLADNLKPLIFRIISEINERDLASMNPTELKGILDVCYKMISQIYGLGSPQVQVTQVEYPQIKFKWDWEQDDDSDY